MQVTSGFSLKDAAKSLGITDCRLRQQLASMGAITKTSFGWTATQAFAQRGLLRTQTRKTDIVTESGQRIPRHYTVVLITGDGLAWLHQLQLPAQPGLEKTA